MIFKAPRFAPHFNREITDKAHPNGTYFGSSKDYYSELKHRGLEPYDPSAPDCGKRKEYKPSKNLIEVTHAIHSQTYKNKFKPSDSLIKKMENMGVKTKITKEDLKYLPKNYQSGLGGFNNAVNS